MSEGWRRLHLTNDGDVPPLLFKYSPTASGYGLYMTDLNYIWSEHLDRKAILKRADRDDTTIDPSGDLEQFKVLLQKIGDGLQNEPSSKASLTPKTQGDAHALELTVTSKLPAPLEPLMWKVYLSKEPQSSTTSHLLLPFIKAEADREAGQQSLIEELNKKDWVLGKLYDKIEAMGIDISTVFPGSAGLRSGRKGPTLSQAGKYVKGLAPFSEQSWREEFSKSSPNAGLSANIVAEMSVGSQVSGQLNSLKPAPDEWWAGLTISDDTIEPSASQEDNKKDPTIKQSTDAMDIDTDAGSETGDDEFERQETPPRLKKPSRTQQKSSSPRKDEEVISPKRKRAKEIKTRLEDHPAPAMRPKAPSTGKPKGLGTIGGKKQMKQKSPSPSPSPPPDLPEPKSPSPPPPRKQQPQQRPVNDDETTDADTDKEPPNHQPKPNNKDTTKPASKPSRGLGAIGGKKKKQPTPEPEPEPEPESEPNNKVSQPQPQSGLPEPQPTQQLPPKKKPLGKLGVIGGQKKDKTKQSSTEGPKTESLSPPVVNAEQKQDQDDEDIKEEEGTRTTRSLPLPSQAPKERQVVKRETTTEPAREETEEEKADRKREELKRQLEAKGKAPAKKKRRF